jgi:YbbR domain-containing protein
MNKKVYLFISIFVSVSIWISIALSDYYYASYRLPIDIINVPDRYSPTPKIPEYVNLKVKAEGWKLLPLELSSDKSFFISAKNDSLTFTENLFQSVELNSWYSNKMSILEINPKTVTVELEPKILMKVKVIPVLNLGFKKGYGLASTIKIVPDSIYIKGPSSQLLGLSHIETNPMELKNLDKSINFKSEVSAYRGFEILQNIVDIHLDIQRIIENSISGVPIQIINLPKNREVTLIPNSVNLSLKGGIEYFSKYTKSDFTVILDYKEILSDTLGYLKPEIHIPSQFTLVSVKPEIIKYIIKQY